MRQFFLCVCLAFCTLLRAEDVIARCFEASGTIGENGFSLGTVLANVDQLKLTGYIPTSSSDGAAAVWVEGNIIKARCFAAQMPTSGPFSLDVATSNVEQLQLTGDSPNGSNGAAAVWVDGSTVKARCFSAGTAIGSGPLTLGSATVSIERLLLTGVGPNSTNRGAAAVWIDGTTVMACCFENGMITGSAFPLGTTTDTQVQLVGDSPNDSSGAAAIWINGTAVMGRCFRNGAALGGTAISLGTGMVSVEQLQLTGIFPASDGAAAVWVDGNNVMTRTFSSTMAIGAAPFSLGTTTSGAEMLRSTGVFPSDGFAAAWADGTTVMARCFGSTMAVGAAPFSLGTAATDVEQLLLTGVRPNVSGNEAVAVWVDGNLIMGRGFVNGMATGSEAFSLGMATTNVQQLQLQGDGGGSFASAAWIDGANVMARCIDGTNAAGTSPLPLGLASPMTVLQLAGRLPVFSAAAVWIGQLPVESGVQNTRRHVRHDR